MPNNKKANMYKEYLVEQGYRPTTDSDGDVVFKKEGRFYILFAEEDDDQYFRLGYPNFWPIESEEERLKAYIACDFANSVSKVAKVHTVKNNVWVTIELYLNKPEDFKDIFERAFPSMNNALKNFVEKMRTKSDDSTKKEGAHESTRTP